MPSPKRRKHKPAAKPSDVKAAESAARPAKATPSKPTTKPDSGAKATTKASEPAKTAEGTGGLPAKVVREKKTAKRRKSS